jgi:fatty-acyl-CoA synthase
MTLIPVADIPRSLFPLPYRTIPAALEDAPATRLFVTMWRSEDEVERMTFGEFRTAVRAQAAFLREKGLRAGDTVILIMPQGIPLMAAFAAAMYLGAVPAILAYPNFKVEPAKYRFGLSGVSANLKARLIVVDEGFPAEWMQHVEIHDNTRLIRLSTATGRSKESGVKPPAEPEHIAFIQHSAGTTGLQKGVALSHSAVMRQINHLAAALRFTREDRLYNWLPLYHDMGLIACFILPLVCHLPVVMQSPTDWVMQPGTMLQLMSEYRCTIAWIPNFTLQFLARRMRPEDRGQLDLSSVRALINCSEPVRAASMDEFVETYKESKLQPHVLQSSYAMAETVFAVTQSVMDGQTDPRRVWVDAGVLRKDQVAKLVSPGTRGAVCFVSSGRCLSGSQVCIVSASGQEARPGHIGEILIQSDSMLEGYYNRPDLTAKALRDGWYSSGDLGFQLEGELYVIGRKKDLIIVAGENIYPQDVEEVASSHPAIHDGRAIALGIVNKDLGTEEIVVVAEVEREEDLARAATIERELKNAIVAELGVAARAIYLKPPKWIVKSTAGKPARSTTREKLLAECPELRASEGEFA